MKLARWMPDGTERVYEIMDFDLGASGIETFFNRQLLRCEPESEYGQIDLVNAEGDIIDEIGISDSRVFQRLRRKLGCRVVDVEAEYREWLTTRTQQEAQDG